MIGEGEGNGESDEIRLKRKTPEFGAGKEENKKNKSCGSENLKQRHYYPTFVEKFDVYDSAVF